MTRRHRIPTIFNIYMVDVLCCALGCVILMWLLNLHESKRGADAATLTQQELERVRARLEEASRQLHETKEAVRSTAKKLQRSEEERLRQSERADTAEKERDALQKEMAEALARLAELNKALAALQSDKKAVEKELALKTKDLDALAKELASAVERSKRLQASLAEKEKMAANAAQTADDLAGRLRLADTKIKELAELARLVPDLKKQLKVSQEEARELEKEAAALRKELLGANLSAKDIEKAYLKMLKEVAERNKQLADADKRIANLLGEKRSLVELLQRTRLAAENRFAGIELTGKNVVFLVDMSGSMELVDERTPAADKWPKVQQALAKVMSSLPDLEQYQVILFSDKPFFPLGQQGRWLKFEPNTTPQQVVKAMSLIKPKGATNMYAALEAAFTYRNQGLDTIYLFSDGLPSAGPGLPAEPTNITESERTALLSRHVRHTLLNVWNRPGMRRVRVNAVGFFYESPEVGAFLWALARENEGSFVGMSKP
ncbi:MAG: hypothetical protein KatS3mg105_1686 [Gemmatales bacterium]|nr:MAG: hypothetical protein KatS3mg105_1686 [Gemmatales bacterium]